MTITDHNDKYLDLKSLAEYCCISVRSLRDYLTDTHDPLPSYCIRRKRLIKRSEFDAWMQRHRSDTGKIDLIVDEVLREFTLPRKNS